MKKMPSYFFFHEFQWIASMDKTFKNLILVILQTNIKSNVFFFLDS